MNTKKRRWISNGLETVLGLILWASALHLLGVERLAPPTIGGLLGSLIVIFACFALAGRLLRFFKGSDATKGEPDLYTQVQAQIAAENAVKRDAKPCDSSNR